MEQWRKEGRKKKINKFLNEDVSDLLAVIRKK